ncbi:MAG: 2-hydroxycarboxylate transporter family protein [Clostridiales bacterium]|nr:2-hydroxycarboxylate transporter family protein [Clostridiales bacterium]
MMSEGKGLHPITFGLPWYLAVGAALVAIVAAMTGALSTDAAGCFALMLAIGIICNEIGERIPIWNTYIGGGLMLTFLASACLFSWQIIPHVYAESIRSVMNLADFLTLYIIIVITGSLLSLDRNLLIRSFRRYIPAILGGLAGASLFGAMAGVLFGVQPLAVILKYMLPIMSGGNGAGAIPLSQIYQTVTGAPSAGYYTFAIMILTVANVFAVLIAALLDRVGRKNPEWTGDGKVLLRKGGVAPTDRKRVGCSVRDLGGAFFLALGFYALGRLLSVAVLPKILGVPIHALTCMIALVLAASMLGIIPDHICAAARRLQAFFSTNMALILMVGVGADTNVDIMFRVLTPANVVIALAIVLGAVIGSAIVGWLVGLYPIDSAITAGLCMANRGGAGDLAVLGASGRMGLISYAQLSTRLGGGIVLILAGILFGQFSAFLN